MCDEKASCQELEAEVDDLSRRLAVSQRRYRQLFESSLAGAFRATLEGHLLDCNDALARIFGLSSRQEAIGRRLQDHFESTEDQQQVFEEFAGGGALHGVELALRDENGHRVWVLASASLVRGSDGEPVEVEGTIVDLTDRKAIEEQLMQAQKMEALGRLAGGVAHDFNNLLQAMAGLPHIMRQERGNPDRIAAAAAELDRLISRGAKVASQLLLFSRREPVRFKALDLNRMVADAAGLLRRLIRENIAIEVSLAPQPLPVRGDRWQLEQVLMNLAVNASDAMPEGGELRLRTGATGDSYVWFEVEDTGHGIEAEVVSQIFEPFFTTKDPAQGTGLGLSVVHGIVNHHAGEVSFETRIGKGSTFRVTLPRGTERAETTGAHEIFVPRDAGARRGAKILLVEDDEGVRRTLTEILDMLGYEVTAMCSGEEAVEDAVDHDWDLLVADYLLPGISGLELAGLCRARQPGLEVILLSGYAEEGALRQSISEGKIRFLKKPCSIKSLAEEIASALGAGGD